MELTRPNRNTPAPGRALPHQRLARWLVEPSSALKHAAQRRKATLLAGFACFLLAALPLLALVSRLSAGATPFPQTSWPFYAALIAIYGLSRTRFARAGAVLLLVIFPASVVANLISGSNANLASTLSFILPSYILASIFFSLWELGAYGVIVAGLLASLPFIDPLAVHGFSSIAWMIIANLFSLALAIIAVIQRDQTDRDQRHELDQAYDNTLESWARALEYRDSNTRNHSAHSAGLSVALAEACGIQGKSLESFYRGALLHDLGKIAIPDRILNKPAPLDEDEWATMRTHPQKAADILSSVNFLGPEALSIPQYHHEWWDGSGYPKGLKGEAIPLPARVFAVIDVYDALTEDRPYRKAWEPGDAMRYILEKSGTQFDPEVVEQFNRLNRLCRF